MRRLVFGGLTLTQTNVICLVAPRPCRPLSQHGANLDTIDTTHFFMGLARESPLAGMRLNCRIADLKTKLRQPWSLEEEKQCESYLYSV